jgi:hypothetical protein
VKKLIAIGLLFSFLSSTTELHEFFKLPHLVYHYFEHGAETGLADFLHLHYAHDHENNHDEHHDKGCLPFQGTHTCQTIGTGALFFEVSTAVNLNPDLSSSNDYLPLSESFTSGYHASIWQPPKIG